MSVQRVQLIVGYQNVRQASLTQDGVFLGRKVNKLWKDCSEGHGKTGQVKKASFFGRSVTVLNTKLNRGSLIDFINATNKILHKTFPKKDLDKGGVFKGGATDQEIEAAFQLVCKDLSVEHKENTFIKDLQEAAAPKKIEDFPFRISRDLVEYYRDWS